MPSIQSFTTYIDSLLGRKLARGDARDVAARTLPADFTGQVFARCREEAAVLDEQTATLDALISETRQALAEADKEVKATRPPIVSPPRRRGALTSFRSARAAHRGGRDHQRNARGPRCLAPLRRHLHPRAPTVVIAVKGPTHKIAERRRRRRFLISI